MMMMIIRFQEGMIIKKAFSVLLKAFTCLYNIYQNNVGDCISTFSIFPNSTYHRYPSWFLYPIYHN